MNFSSSKDADFFASNPSFLDLKHPFYQNHDSQLILSPFFSVDSPAFKKLSKSLEDFTSKLQTYRMEDKSQVGHLDAKTEFLESQIHDLVQKVQGLQQTINQIEKFQNKQNLALLSDIHRHVQSPINQLKVDFNLFLLEFFGFSTLFTLLLILLLFFLLRQKPKPILESVIVQNTLSHEVQEDNDYNFLETEEGIGSRIDLARAYKDMEDYMMAIKELKKVIQLGTQDQKSEAKALLKEVQTASQGA